MLVFVLGVRLRELDGHLGIVVIILKLHVCWIVFIGDSVLVSGVGWQCLLVLAPMLEQFTDKVLVDGGSALIAIPTVRWLRLSITAE